MPATATLIEIETPIMLGNVETTDVEWGIQAMLNGEQVEIPVTDLEEIYSNDEDFHQSSLVYVVWIDENENDQEWQIEITDDNRSALDEILFPD